MPSGSSSGSNSAVIIAALIGAVAVIVAALITRDNTVPNPTPDEPQSSTSTSSGAVIGDLTWGLHPVVPVTVLPTEPPDTSPVTITGDVCNDGFCIAVDAYDWFWEFLDGSANPTNPFDSCGDRSQYVADFGVRFKVTNNSGSSVALQYSDSDFKAKDSFGNRFRLLDFECNPSMISNAVYHPSSYKFKLEDGESFVVGPTYDFGDTLPGAGSSRGQVQLLAYLGSITNETEFVVVSVENFGRIEHAAWKFDVPR
jgi:hypothetical protein